jgi:hypothetical protein
VGIVLGTIRLNTKNTGEEWRQDDVRELGYGGRYEAHGSESESCPMTGLLLIGAQRLVSANILTLILLKHLKEFRLCYTSITLIV